MSLIFSAYTNSKDFNGTSEQLSNPYNNISNQITWSVNVYLTEDLQQSKNSNELYRFYYWILDSRSSETAGIQPIFINNDGNVQFWESYKKNGDYFNTYLQPEHWYNITIVYNYMTVECYINGELKGIKQLTAPITQNWNTMPLYVGQRFQTNTHKFKGKISDLRIYNHALTSLEIKELCNQNMILHYDFTDIGKTLNDPLDNTKLNATGFEQLISFSNPFYEMSGITASNNEYDFTLKTTEHNKTGTWRGAYNLNLVTVDNINIPIGARIRRSCTYKITTPTQTPTTGYLTTSLEVWQAGSATVVDTKQSGVFICDGAEHEAYIETTPTSTGDLRFLFYFDSQGENEAREFNLTMKIKNVKTEIVFVNDSQLLNTPSYINCWKTSDNKGALFNSENGNGIKLPLSFKPINFTLNIWFTPTSNQKDTDTNYPLPMKDQTLISCTENGGWGLGGGAYATNTITDGGFEYYDNNQYKRLDFGFRTPNKWQPNTKYMITIVFDTTNHKVVGYINGKYCDSNIVNNFKYSTVNLPITIGREPSAFSPGFVQPFDGIIHDIKFYKHCFSASEVLDLYGNTEQRITDINTIVMQKYQNDSYVNLLSGYDSYDYRGQVIDKLDAVPIDSNNKIAMQIFYLGPPKQDNWYYVYLEHREDSDGLTSITDSRCEFWFTGSGDIEEEYTERSTFFNRNGQTLKGSWSNALYQKEAPKTPTENHNWQFRNFVSFQDNGSFQSLNSHNFMLINLTESGIYDKYLKNLKADGTLQERVSAIKDWCDDNLYLCGNSVKIKNLEPIQIKTNGINAEYFIENEYIEKEGKKFLKIFDYNLLNTSLKQPKNFIDIEYWRTFDIYKYNRLSDLWDITPLSLKRLYGNTVNNNKQLSNTGNLSDAIDFYPYEFIYKTINNNGQINEIHWEQAHHFMSNATKYLDIGSQISDFPVSYTHVFYNNFTNINTTTNNSGLCLSRQFWDCRCFGLNIFSSTDNNERRMLYVRVDNTNFKPVQIHTPKNTNIKIANDIYKHNYIPVEYLQTGNTVLPINIQPLQPAKWVVDIQFVGLSNKNFYGFGIKKNIITANNNNEMFGYSTNEENMCYGNLYEPAVNEPIINKYGSSATNCTNSICGNRDSIVLDFKNGKATVNGQTDILNKNIPTNSVFNLFGLKDENSNITNMCNCRIFGCKAYDENGKLIVDLVPVYNSLSGGFGLMNIANDYENIKQYQIFNYNGTDSRISGGPATASIIYADNFIEIGG